jgi:signal transduction histidine kinase
MKRLYQKIYLTIVGTLIVVVAIAGMMWRLGTHEPPWTPGFEVAGELAAAILPPPEEGAAAQQEMIERLARKLQLDLALFDSNLRPVAAFGRPVPPPSGRAGWQPGPGGPRWSLPLPDGRWIVARAPPRFRNPFVGLVFFLGAIALVVALCAFPVVRGLTRRLERLQTGVETLGAGQLSARVKVEGRDEVARLATSFNAAAGRIEELVNSHRMLLANTSHELRTPLARLRLGLELFKKDGDPKHKQDLERDIAELDALLDEILLASRLEAAPALQREDIDLLALAAEEAAHYEQSEAEGDPITIRGDARLLRRLIRNLLENARRHGKPPVRVAVRRENDRAMIDVIDCGPGVPPAERERVFEPFYRRSSDSSGAGLGLSLCRQIARLHGGDVAAVAYPDTLSAFRVTLPVSLP